MFSADELLMGATPYVSYAGPSSAAISAGAAPVMTNGVAADAGVGLGTVGARVGARASGSAILIAWLLIVVLLVASNVLTLRVQG